MAITYIQERQGGASRENGKLTRFRVLLFHATAGSNPGDILLDEKIPADGSGHPDYIGFYCTGVSAPQKVNGSERDGSYTVQVNYSANAADIPAQKDNTGKPPWEQKAYNVSFGSREVVVPQLFAYADDDFQFDPTKPVVHPATGEQIISDTVENHGTISFSYAVKTWNYSWMREYRNTTNNSGITILGYSFPSQTLLLSKLGASLKSYTDANSKVFPYWEISVEIEDFGRVIDKQLALQGYHFIKDGKDYQIQFKENASTGGEYGWFEANASLNISTPRWVSKAGAVLPANGTVSQTDHYDSFPDIYWKEWASLGLPKGKI